MRLLNDFRPIQLASSVPSSAIGNRFGKPPFANKNGYYNKSKSVSRLFHYAESVAGHHQSMHATTTNNHLRSRPQSSPVKQRSELRSATLGRPRSVNGPSSAILLNKLPGNRNSYADDEDRAERRPHCATPDDSRNSCVDDFDRESPTSPTDPLRRRRRSRPDLVDQLRVKSHHRQTIAARPNSLDSTELSMSSSPSPPPPPTLLSPSPPPLLLSQSPLQPQLTQLMTINADTTTISSPPPSSPSTHQTHLTTKAADLQPNSCAPVEIATDRHSIIPMIHL